MFTREQVRQAYADSAIKRLPITHERMTKLRNKINSEMLGAALMDGTFHMEHPAKITVLSDNAASLRCEAHYFNDREAVTFNHDGFVGFAGWADDTHVQPILGGFMNWIHDEENEIAS